MEWTDWRCVNLVRLAIYEQQGFIRIVKNCLAGAWIAFDVVIF
jgi:hypothetical protein